MFSRRSLTLTLAAVTATVTLAACGSSGGGMGGMSGMDHGSTSATGGSSSSPSGRAADITFAQSMIPHHQQAVEMADIALGKTTASKQVRTLATQIKKAQDPEITTMTGWLKTWGTPTTMPGMTGHDMSGMTGMMSKKEMAALKSASGSAFDRKWLTMMIGHHRGAITMATDVLKTSQDPDVKTLAQSIIKGQKKEITTMTDLLGPVSPTSATVTGSTDSL
ncbi:DUF305 domain-containing protein [Yimella sp. cx-51]|uniref:DUF305 domain-containing protein n=1 Tax=Yimella sp. cx-51 TaxID=2770551 RepID=UPI00165E60B8|nr:DUF305 domain-containing protein [Yimella sp. cx-51]MBC9957292.1 DUF305 domain-containing protein [Yimella sp. cx-51]MBD2760905.1 DUF305 domain-containing protein [Yimella sp. cx-573]QTH36837.1 DUF305 domain-containing protein [Yimella sp. cx-51]